MNHKIIFKKKGLKNGWRVLIVMPNAKISFVDSEV